MTRRVVLSPEASADIRSLYDHIAELSGSDRASGFTGRIMAFCRGLADFPERGLKRDDLRPGLRVAGLERRVSIAFHIAPEMVVIDRIFYGGRDIERMLSDT